MGRGRRPLPTSVKKLRGNPGKRKLSKDEPAPAIADPACPKELSKAAKKEWNSILPILREMKVLTEADSKALAAYCHNFARWMEAEKEISRLGILVEEPVLGKPDRDTGEQEVLGYKYKKNPAVNISHEAQKLMKSFLIEFGMTPAARTKIRIEKPAEADPFEAYLAGAGAPAADAKPN
jgi:P27 family predicted phage terminase small subunit